MTNETQGFTPEFEALERFTRKALRPIVELNEETVRRIGARLASLSRAGFSEENIERWAKWKAQEIAEQGPKSPAAVLVKALGSGDPGDMPKPKVKVNPEGHSPAPDYRRTQQENRDQVDDEYGDTSPPVSLCLPLGRALRRDDPQHPDPFKEAQLILDREWKKQERPRFYKFDASGLGLDQAALADFQAGQAEASAHFERHSKGDKS